MEVFDAAAWEHATADGIAAAQQGDFARAVAAMHRAVVEADKLPPTDGRRLGTYVNAGATHVRARQWDQAQKMYEAALGLASIALPPEDPRLGDIHVNLGGIALELGREQDAQTHHERALALWSRALPPDHPRLALLRQKIAAPRTFGTPDGVVVVVPPTDDGWQTEQAVQDAGTGRVWLVKCRRADRSQFFFMMAKDYTAPRDQLLPAKTLAEEVYKRNYEKTFTDVRYVSSVALAPNVHEIRVTMHHASMGAITKRERVTTVDDHVLIVSAEGKTEVFGRFDHDVDAWFARTRFRAAGS